MVEPHRIKVIFQRMPNQYSILRYDSIQVGIKRALDGVSDWVKYLLSDPTELGIVVENLVSRFEQLVKDDLFLVVYDGASGKLEPHSCGHHFAVDY